MADPRYDELVGLWRAGQIDDDKLKRGLVLLHSISTQADASSVADQEVQRKPAQNFGATHWTRWPARLLLPISWLEGLSPLRRELVEIVVFAIVMAAVIIGGALLTVVAIIASVDTRSPINPLGAAAWTAILLLVCGFVVGYQRYAMAVLAVPIFLVLLLSPLWKEKSGGDPASASTARTVVSGYTRHVTQAEFGLDWPFPAYQSGLIRCDVVMMGTTRRPLVTIELGGSKYGLNGAARDFGYPDSRSQMSEHPQWGTYKLGASDKMIDSALAACG